MSDLSKRFNEIIKDIETNLKNKEDLDYVKSQIANITMLFMDTIDTLTQMNEQKIKYLMQKQEDIEKKLSQVDSIVNGIEKDIYEEGEMVEENEGYDFEIVCPYCNHEFVADFDSQLKEEIQCPECKNIIELDWNMAEDNCMGECSCCKEECEALPKEEIIIESDEENDFTYKENKKEQEDEEQEDDDM